MKSSRAQHAAVVRVLCLGKSLLMSHGHPRALLRQMTAAPFPGPCIRDPGVLVTGERGTLVANPSAGVLRDVSVRSQPSGHQAIPGWTKKIQVPDLKSKD